jgi:hypothetical protein
MYFKLTTKIMKNNGGFDFNIIGNINIKIDDIYYDNIPILYYQGKFFVRAGDLKEKIEEENILKIEQMINKSNILAQSVNKFLLDISKLMIISKDENVYQTNNK